MQSDQEVSGQLAALVVVVVCNIGSAISEGDQLILQTNGFRTMDPQRDETGEGASWLRYPNSHTVKIRRMEPCKS